MWVIRMDDRSKLERYLLIFIYFGLFFFGIQPQNFHICHIKSVLPTLLSSSPYKTGFPPSGKVGLGGGESEKQLNTSFIFLQKIKKPPTYHLSCLYYYPPLLKEYIQAVFWMNPPGELLEGAESDHRSHALTGWRERRVEQDVADTGHVHHTVVVQIGRERHPVTLTKRVVPFYLYCTFYTSNYWGCFGDKIWKEWRRELHFSVKSKYTVIGVSDNVHLSPLRTSQQFWSQNRLRKDLPTLNCYFLIVRNS